MYGAAYNYGGSNLVDYQIPELPYGVSSTTQIGIMAVSYTHLDVYKRQIIHRPGYKCKIPS